LPIKGAVGGIKSQKSGQEMGEVLEFWGLPFCWALMGGFSERF